MNDMMQMCCNMKPFLNILRIVIRLLQFSVPLILLVLGTVDMIKAVTSNDEKTAKNSLDTFIKRLMYGVLVFLVPFLVRLVLNIINNNILKGSDVDSMNWLGCWNEAMNKTLDSTCKNYKDIYIEEKNS